MIYLSLNLKPSPDLSESKYFGLRKYDCVKNLKYFCSYKKFAYYVIKKGTLGYFHVSIHSSNLYTFLINYFDARLCSVRYLKLRIFICLMYEGL